jgi:dynamin-like GTPase MGM1, mitochondrial
LNLLAQKYWNKPIEDLSVPEPEIDPLSQLPKASPDDTIWQLKLDASSASLTKLGIGRLATSVVANALQAHIDRLVASSTFASHPFARKAIHESSSTILRDLSYDISDELEICIKPYKYRIELEDSEWAKGRENVHAVLKDELRLCEGAVKQVEMDVGGRKRLREVMGFIDRVRSGQVVLEGDGIGGAGGFSAALLQRGNDCSAMNFRWMSNKSSRSRRRLLPRQSRHHQNAHARGQVKAMRVKGQQVPLPRGLSRCRGRQVDDDCGSLP